MNALDLGQVIILSLFGCLLLAFAIHGAIDLAISWCARRDERVVVQEYPDAADFPADIEAQIAETLDLIAWEREVSS